MLQPEFPILNDNRETFFIENGRQLYLKTYHEIFRAKLPDIYLVESEISTNVLVRILSTLDLLFDSSQKNKSLPPLGTTGEILTKIALESKGIKAKKSTLGEDVKKGYDFTILGRKVDITTSHLDTTFIKKYTAGHPVTLYVPNCPFAELRNLHNPMIFPNESSYGYKLIYEDTFDIDQYLKETFELNNNVFNILYSHYNDTLESVDTVNDSNFGTITPELLSSYEGFLNDLALEIYIHT